MTWIPVMSNCPVGEFQNRSAAATPRSASPDPDPHLSEVPAHRLPIATRRGWTFALQVGMSRTEGMRDQPDPRTSSSRPTSDDDSSTVMIRAPVGTPQGCRGGGSTVRCPRLIGPSPYPRQGTAYSITARARIGTTRPVLVGDAQNRPHASASWSRFWNRSPRR
jgi:hypothetical protein